MESNRSQTQEEIFAIREEAPSDALLRALSEVHGGDLSEMKPLYEVIDVDALDDLFRGPNPGTVTFEYGTYTVTIRENAEIVLEE